MLYLHDVWVNWFEGEENGYNVGHFHEWRRDDNIELIDRIPVVYITKSLFEYIENTLEDLPKALLEQIYQKTYIRKGYKKIMINYACIVTDGKRVLAIDTMNYSVPMRKSRLIPRQDRAVLEMVRSRKPKSYQFKQKGIKKEYHLLSLKPELVIGLTRREKQLKQLLMMALDHLRLTNNLEELRYWLIEWKPEFYAEIDGIDKRKAWETLYEDIKYGWSSHHEHFAEKLIRGNLFLEQLWEQENSHSTHESEMNRNQ